MTLTRPSCEKPTHGDGQTFKTCRSEGASQNLEQLCEAHTLYDADLDPELEKQVKERCPHLLEEPKLSE